MVGIDISSYQKGINFDKLKSEIDFIILRGGFTGYGDGVNLNKDKCFEDFYAKAKARNIPVGVYWYSCANNYTKGQKEALYLYEKCLKGKQFEFPIYIDVEEKRWQCVGKDKINSAIKGFCDTLEDLGYYVGIYASTYWFNTYIDTANLKEYDKWVAQWSSIKPNFKYGRYGLWQNTNKKQVAGYSVDGDVSYENYPAIMKSCGLNGFSKQSKKPETTTIKKTNEELAKEVIAGKWGNGQTRKNKLTQAGYEYSAVQKIVNKMLK